MALNTVNSVELMGSKKGTGWMVFADDLEDFKAFINSIPAGRMVFCKPKRVGDDISVLEISSFVPKQKTEA